MARVGLGALVVLVAGTWSVSASAEGTDIVYLRDGRVLHGTIVEVVPNVELRIRLSDDEVRTVPRDQVMNFVRAPAEEGSLASLRSAPATAPAAASPEPVGPATGTTLTPAPASPASSWPDAAHTVLVHLSGVRAAQLQAAAPDGTWVTVCSTTCDEPLAVDGRYRLVGSGIRRSRSFSLQAAAGESDEIHVDEASSNAFASGIVVLSVVPPLSLLTIFSIYLGHAFAGDGGPLGGVDFTVVGAAAAAGVVAIVGGVGLIVSNAHTGVTQIPVSPSAAAAPPMWRGPEQAAFAHAADRFAVGLPLFTATF